MFHRSTLTATSLSAGALLLTALFAACGGDDSPPEDTGSADGGEQGDTGGSSSTGGSSNATGGASEDTGGSSSGGAAGDSSGSTGGTQTSTGGAGGAGDEGCVGVAVPSSRISDFSEIAAGTTWTTGSKSWGDSVSLTGGTFHYQGTDVTPLTATITEEGGLRLQATIPANGYVGFGMWFGPSCSDASAFDGISFAIGGDGGNTQIQVQVQMSRDYPIDAANNKGECEFTDEETKWSECTNNATTIEGVNATQQEYQLGWEEFQGGTPITPLDPTELLGIQWQFNCGSADCPLDVVLDDVMFYTG